MFECCFKVWLAGPVLIVVGAVLCGKVMIDWGPAMERGRAGSVDSRLVDEVDSCVNDIKILRNSTVWLLKPDWH